jgi:hypothetical protein
MNTKWHIEALEALGMKAGKATIINKLNSASIRTEDPKLRDLAKQLIDEVQAASSNTKAFAPKDLTHGVPTAKVAIAYLESVIYSGEASIELNE